jgi:hypothetical protein
LRKAPSSKHIVLGYAQSWALFRMLMEQRPKEMQKYLALIWARRTPENRLADFVEVFGSDLGKLEVRYQRYLREAASP